MGERRQRPEPRADLGGGLLHELELRGLRSRRNGPPIQWIGGQIDGQTAQTEAPVSPFQIHGSALSMVETGEN